MWNMFCGNAIPVQINDVITTTNNKEFDDNVDEDDDNDIIGNNDKDFINIVGDWRKN